MAGLSADQRNHYYLLEAVRTGIHKPILAALHLAHGAPVLADGEAGLGISPANRISLEEVDGFLEQVQFAANTVRSVTDRLTAQGWKGSDIWNSEAGCYTDRFLQILANGYIPPMSDPVAARLEPADETKLKQAYLEDWTIDCDAVKLPADQTFLETVLLKFVEGIPRYYLGLLHQREALLEGLRLWRKLNTRQAAIASLLRRNFNDPSLEALDETTLDKPLLQFTQQIAPFYAGYPHQRESLLRLVQRWRQTDSREAAIVSLAAGASAEMPGGLLDPALVAFSQRLPLQYQGKGDQRNALTETLRIWHGLDTRSAALQEVGIDPHLLTSSNPNRTALINAVAQLDRGLLEFIKRIPATYQETEQQREALIRLVQHWRELDSRETAIQILLDDLQRLTFSQRIEPQPLALIPPLSRPARWLPNNLQLHASILPGGSLTWADATRGGIHMPADPATIAAIVQIAELAQQVSDRLGCPLRIVNWYSTPTAQRAHHKAGHPIGCGSRHALGDAIDFYCDGLTGSQLYRALDPWWAGGLGRYAQYPILCHIDARSERVRWTR